MRKDIHFETLLYPVLLLYLIYYANRVHNHQGQLDNIPLILFFHRKKSEIKGQIVLVIKADRCGHSGEKSIPVDIEAQFLQSTGRSWTVHGQFYSLSWKISKRQLLQAYLWL